MKILKGINYYDMVACGAANLGSRREEVNDLNVFPVPDGDTGDNMFMTIAPASEMEFDEKAPISEVSLKIAEAMLISARGNSGVILSQIFKGLAEGLLNYTEVNVLSFQHAMQKSVETAYSAVTKPVEGTILSVLKESVTGVEVIDEMDFEEYFGEIIVLMKKCVEETPEKMELLREAGVVDSGAAGLFYVFEGMRNALEGARSASKAASANRKSVDVALFTENSVLEYGYCTEFLLRLQVSKVPEIAKFDLDKLILELNQLGDSVVAFQNDSIVKVHIHTKTPGKVLNLAQKYGEFLTLKIENMTLQHNHQVKKPKKKRFGIVAAANGEGVKKLFKELGVDVVIEGGRGLNPSTEDFLKAFSECNTEVIFVFPNNKNTVMAARQAGEIYEEGEARGLKTERADVYVIPTRNIGQGYGALSMLDLSSNDPETVTAELIAAAKATKTGFVTRASKKAVLDGVVINPGDYFGFDDERVYVSTDERLKTMLELSKKMKLRDVAILVRGENAPESEAKVVFSVLSKTFKDVEFIEVDGGQALHDYILISI